MSGQTPRQTSRQTYRQTYRQTFGQNSRQISKETSEQSSKETSEQSSVKLKNLKKGSLLSLLCLSFLLWLALPSYIGEDDALQLLYHVSLASG